MVLCLLPIFKKSISNFTTFIPFFRLESSRNPAAEGSSSTSKSHSGRTPHHQPHHPPPTQRMSPFDELMAQHQQQIQRERQLLGATSRHAHQSHHAHHSHGPPLRGTAAAAAVAAAASNPAGSSEDSPRIPPIPPLHHGTPVKPLEMEVPMVAEPPFEYSTPAMSEFPRKSLSENTADVKKGLLSSILEKVRSKEEADQLARGLKHQHSNRFLGPAPLASSESLTVSEASTKRPVSNASTNPDSTMSEYPPVLSHVTNRTKLESCHQLDQF